MLPLVGAGEAGSLRSMGYAGCTSRALRSGFYGWRRKMNPSCALCLSASLRER
ncbi:MAG: hypothetical protein K2M83_05230 [Muribaculaceae bacterium]|nr:hypothetical protein [Muribaculaceae bacterium]MDE6856306.1 hypothetical protein [Muribaculaceae bacterium]